MDRRALLATVGTAVLAGCLTDSDPEAEPTPTDFDSGERVRECEKEYIESEIVTRDDETLDGPLSPNIVNTESREAGQYFELETGYNVVREPMRDDEPEEYGHGEVTAYYLVDGDDVYRTEGGEAEGDPRDGVTLDC